MNKRSPLLALLLTLGSCGEPQQPANGAADPDAEVVLEKAPETMPEPPFDFTGTWAATPELCSGGRWRFASNRVVTDGETMCEIHRALGTGPEVANLTLMCSAEGREGAEDWRLTRQGANRMVVRRTEKGHHFAEVTLQRCGQG